MIKYANNARKTIINGQFPTFVSPSHIQSNTELTYVRMLTTLEEKLVSPRMAFVQIRQLGYKKAQIGLTRTIINAPTNFG